MTVPEAFQIAVQHHQAGRLADAERLYRQILTAQPNQADALHLLGVIAHQTGRHDVAVELIRQSVAINPTNPFAYSNLGETYRAMGRLDEAVASYRRALDLKPDYPEAHYNLGIARQERGQLSEAITAYRRALDLKPDYPEAHNNLGIALRDRGQFDEAITAYRNALELQPGYPGALNNLGVALRDRGQLDESVAAYRRALELQPNYAEALSNLGVALAGQGQFDEAIASYRHALELQPGRPGVHSNLIYTLHFHPGHGGRTIAEEQELWNRQFAEPLKPLVRPHANDCSSGRRLRIGYVSPHFRDHVIGRNLIPLFECHDRGDFDILCYSGVSHPDKLTEEFRARAREWRSTVGVADEALAEMIRRDGVDILVDLTQHLGGNRLPMFARKPAPVQVSFAGYPESTGLEAIEYRISDRCLEVDPAAKGRGSNEQVCLIDSFWCYDPRGIEMEINGLPAKESGSITFGCLNHFRKVNERVLRLWARVLGMVSGSRLVLLSNAGSHRQRTLMALEREGVDARRVEFLDYRPLRGYLELYHRVDIVLDTFPYNGHTTSLDALWMGVPVVSLAGNTPLCRAGLSQLTNVGLPELIAHSEPEYVNVAENLARDLPRLERLRSTLRGRMMTSVLMDAPHLTRQMEQAYRSMWERWRQRQSLLRG